MNFFRSFVSFSFRVRVARTRIRNDFSRSNSGYGSGKSFGSDRIRHRIRIRNTVPYLFTGVLIGLLGLTPSSSRVVSWAQTARWVCGRGAPSSGASPPRPPPTSSAPFTFPTPASGGPSPQMPKRLSSSPIRQTPAGPIHRYGFLCD